MKKMIVLAGLMLVSVTAKAQWNVSSSNDPFEGKTVTIIGTGYDGDYPYSNPSIVFRKRESLEVYVTGAGSTACDDILKVSFSFGDHNDILTFQMSESVNGSAGFLEFDPLSITELVNRLKQNNIVYVEWRTRCSRNVFKINLSGSKKALNVIFNEDWNFKFKKLLALKEKQEAEKVKFMGKIVSVLRSIGVENEWDAPRIYSKIRAYDLEDIKFKFHKNTNQTGYLKFIDAETGNELGEHFVIGINN